jgi:hypothetical protein
MLPLEVCQQPGEPIVLQLKPERTIDVTREASGTADLASFRKELILQSEGDFLDSHVRIVFRVGFGDKEAATPTLLPAGPLIAQDSVQKF